MLTKQQRGKIGTDSSSSSRLLKPLDALRNLTTLKLRDVTSDVLSKRTTSLTQNPTCLLRTWISALTRLSFQRLSLNLEQSDRARLRASRTERAEVLVTFNLRTQSRLIPPSMLVAQSN